MCGSLLCIVNPDADSYDVYERASSGAFYGERKDDAKHDQRIKVRITSFLPMRCVALKGAFILPRRAGTDYPKNRGWDPSVRTGVLMRSRPDARVVELYVRKGTL